MGNAGSYDKVLADFARMGAEIIQTDPHAHYERIGRNARQKMVPGYIPIDQPPLLTMISYYPNEAGLPSFEWANAQRHFLRWGETGDVADYIEAYRGWLAFRDQVPFNRKWLAPLLEALCVRYEEMAWLPLVKCPLPAGTAVDKEGMDIYRDRTLLSDQVNIIKPAVVLVQGKVVHDVIGPWLDNLQFIRTHAVQRIPQYRPKADMAQRDLDALVKELKPHIECLRAERST
jgi:hypothetical protein